MMDKIKRAFEIALFWTSSWVETYPKATLAVWAASLIAAIVFI